jgi:hypothetical protein
MTERWRDELDRLGRAEPDRERIRTLAAGGPRMPGGDRGSGRRVVAAVIALAVAAASFALVVTVFRGAGPKVSATPPPSPTATGAPPTTAAADLDPAAICQVPTFDPDVALLVGSDTVQYPKPVLDEPGVPASALDGPAADALRARLATPAAGHAPSEGWRAIGTSPSAVRYAAPYAPGEWWIEAFEERDGSWQHVDEEIAERRETPAQLGHGLELSWNADLLLHGGAWNRPLDVVNDRSSTWMSLGTVARLAAIPHVFDTSTGQLVGPGAYEVYPSSTEVRLQPGERTAVPVALGASITALHPGEYAVVACLPDLGLASPVGTLRISDEAAVRDVRVLTYEPNGTSMGALTGGTLAVVNGCLGLQGDRGPATYLILPQGYALVVRDGTKMLIDPLGNEVGALGDRVSFGGGGSPISGVEHAVIDGIPEPCRTGGGYFLASGAA